MQPFILAKSLTYGCHTAESYGHTVLLDDHTAFHTPHTAPYGTIRIRRMKNFQNHTVCEDPTDDSGMFAHRAGALGLQRDASGLRTDTWDKKIKLARRSNYEST
jgi:hypothetical protein